MNKTQNFGLTLPELDDFYDIEVFNQNNRIIDTFLHELAGSGAKELIATFTASGTFHIANHGLSIGDRVDAYIVGAGGGGSVSHGGGGGHCLLLQDVILTQATFPIVIGAGGNGGASGTNGGASSAFGVSMPGGNGSAGSPTAPGAGGSGGGRGSTANTGAPHNGGDGGTAGSSGSGVSGAAGSGNQGRTPVNPYDNIAYGCGGGGANGGRGGGAPGRGGGGNGGGLTGGDGHPGGGGGGGGIPSGSGGRGGNGIVYIYARPGRHTSHQGAITTLSDDEATKTIAILKGDICIDVAVFQTGEDVQNFLTEGCWSEADAMKELDNGFGIGDKWDGETWIRQEPPQEAQS